MSRTSGRRGLIVVFLVLLVLAAMVDLLRPGSAILKAWRGANRPTTPIERAVKEFTKARPTPLPRSNRVLGNGAHGVISEAQAPGLS